MLLGDAISVLQQSIDLLGQSNPLVEALNQFRDSEILTKIVGLRPVDGVIGSEAKLSKIEEMLDQTITAVAAHDGSTPIVTQLSDLLSFVREHRRSDHVQNRDYGTPGDDNPGGGDHGDLMGSVGWWED